MLRATSPHFHHEKGDSGNTARQKAALSKSKHGFDPGLFYTKLCLLRVFSFSRCPGTILAESISEGFSMERCVERAKEMIKQDP